MWHLSQPGRLDVSRVPVRSLLAVLAALGLIGTAAPAAVSAERVQVVAFVSIAPSNELAADLEALGELVQNSSLGQALLRVLAERSGLRQLGGLDPGRSTGLAVITDGLQVAPLALIPVDDVQRLLASLEPLIGTAAKRPDLGHNIWKVGKGVVTAYVYQRDGWAFVAQTEDLFEQLLSVEQIEQEFKQLPAGHDVALRFYPLRLPEALRTFGIDLLHEQMRLLEPVDQQTEQAAAHARMNRVLLDVCESSLGDQQRVTWTWQFDRHARQARLELEILPAADSRFERHLAACKRIPSPTVSVPETSWLTFHSGLQVDPALRTRLTQLSHDLLLTAQQETSTIRGESTERHAADNWQRLGNELVGSALRRGELIADAAVAGGTLPLTALVTLPRDGDASFESLLERAESDGGDSSGGLRIDRNYSQIAGRAVHRIQLAVAAQPSLVDQCFGGEVCHLTATSRDLLLAVGPQSSSLLEQAIGGQRNRAVPSMRHADLAIRPSVLLSIKAADLLSVIGSTLADRRQKLLLSLVGGNLRSADDRVVLTIEPTAEALRASLVMHEGVLRAAAMGLNLIVLEALSSAPGTQSGTSRDLPKGD